MTVTPVVGKPALLRELNEQAVLDALRKNGPLSRSDLTALLRLSKSTVSAVVAGLLAHGLVRETHAPAGRVGRRPIMLEINPDSGYVVGIDLGATLLRAVTADLAGQVRSRVRASSPTMGLEALVEAIERIVTRAVGEGRLSRERLACLAIGVPGAVDAAQEEVRLCPNLSFLEGVRLREMLSRRLRVPVTMDNDVNLAAIGEKWRGRASTVRDFVYIAVGTGVGMGIVLGGELRRGATGYAGEIGYLPVPWNGGHVPIETLIAGPAIARREGDAHGKMSAEAVFAAAQGGDQKALEVVDEVARLLAWSIACVNVTLDLSLVVLGGGVGANTDLLLPRIQRELAALTPFAPVVAPSALAGEATLYGAVAVALRAARAMLEGPRRIVLTALAVVAGLASLRYMGSVR
jgi:predicted NBD/HSP70 family sugar kinase